jgi:spectinomycin phosphotransferase
MFGSPPANTFALLDSVLATHYGLTDVHIQPAPRGSVAETYTVRLPASAGAESLRYFAKFIPISRYSANLEASLPVLVELHRLGVTKLNIPTPTLDGKLSITLEAHVFVLLSYIDGISTFEYDFAQFVAGLAHVHSVTPQVQSPIKREGFGIAVKDDLFARLNQVWTRSMRGEIQADTQSLLLQYRAELLNDFARLEQLATAFARNADALDMVITHGDAPRNVIEAPDETLYLIDWDDLLLAPRERDLWFHLGKVGGEYYADSETLLKVYRQTFPDYQINWHAYDYYLLLRYFEDLEFLILNIIAEDSTDETRRSNFRWLRESAFGWLRVLVRDRYP